MTWVRLQYLADEYWDYEKPWSSISEVIPMQIFYHCPGCLRRVLGSHSSQISSSLDPQFVVVENNSQLKVTLYVHSGGGPEVGGRAEAEGHRSSKATGGDDGAVST